MSALQNIKREIATASIELGNRRDLHGKTSASYKQQRDRLAQLKQQEWEIKCDMAYRVGSAA